jgi:hypothetical protein
VPKLSVIQRLSVLIADYGGIPALFDVLFGWAKPKACLSFGLPRLTEDCGGYLWTLPLTLPFLPRCANAAQAAGGAVVQPSLLARPEPR